MLKQTVKNSENGIATLEFAVTAAFFLMMIVAVVAGGHFFWTHNAIVESTRRGARYAAGECNPADNNCPGRADVLTRVQNVVLYGSPIAGTEPLVGNLRREQIVVTYSQTSSTPANPNETFGVATGTVSVKIQNYGYNFVLSPVVLRMPPYQTTVRGESAGYQAAQNVCP
ncbi:MAG TPA: TadE family protein [Pyrinomonadaceae bacterium]